MLRPFGGSYTQHQLDCIINNNSGLSGGNEEKINCCPFLFGPPLILLVTEECFARLEHRLSLFRLFGGVSPPVWTQSSTDVRRKLQTV
jgi:hypothetical protein